MKKAINIVLIIFCFSALANAQPKNKNIARLDVSFVVKNADGQPIAGANVFANKGKYELQTDKDGKIAIDGVPGNTKVLIQYPGYQDAVLDLASSANKKEVILVQALPGQTEKDVYDLYDGISMNKRQTVGAVSVIQGEDLETFPTLSLTNALQGRALGLSVDMNLGGMSENNASFLIRGLHRQGGDGPIVVIDGMERAMNDLVAEEIETVQILKDATSKILYGPRAANGVILITTKQGKMHKRVIKASVEQYVGITNRMPEFLDSYQYATLYNKALENDGLAPIYTDDDLQGYMNSKGEYDLRYPNVDYYDYFLRDYTTNTKATTQFIGGDEKTKYAVVLGFNHGQGLEKLGYDSKYDRVNLRGNVDMKLNSMFSANMGIAIRIESKKGAKMNSSQMFSQLSSIRPNEYPFLLDTAAYPIVPILEDGSLVAGASLDKASNLYADVVLDGYDKTQYINNQMNLGLKADLNTITEGLSADAYITFDNYFLATYRLDKATPTFAVRWDKTDLGADTAIFMLRKMANLDATEGLNSRNSDRNLGASGKINFERSFGDHSLQSNLGYYFSLNERHGLDQNIVNSNTYLRTHYSFKNKYIVEGTVAAMRSNRFADDKQVRVYPALGAAWILSEDADKLEYMKLKASWGIIGYDAGTTFPLRANRWNNPNSIQFGDGNSGKSSPVVQLINYGSPYMGWEESNEINVGLEGMLFRNRLSYEVNAFTENRTKIEGVISELYSEVYGLYVPHENYKKVRNSGIEMEVQWTDRIGELTYSIGANALYSKNKFTQRDETMFEDEYRQLEGKPTDAMMGYVSEGLFTSPEQIAGDDFQALGTQTSVGDINYADLNNDGVIDELDQKVIGNDTPRLTMGINLNLNYKGFGLYALGTAALGYDVDMSDIYYTTGNQKYMTYALNAYDPATGVGSLPRLTAVGRSANNQLSDFWLEKGDYFRLKNVELSYTLFNNKTSALISKAKFFVRGSNLFVLSSIKDVDPEVKKAGIDNYPVLSTYSAGVSVNF